MKRMELIEMFAALGRRLEGGVPREVAAAAVEENPWFSIADIDHAVESLCCEMLDRRKLAIWLSAYDGWPVAKPKKIAIVMAGNIPLVGFYDLLCTICAGHTVYVKPSGRDTVLSDYIASIIGNDFIKPLTDDLRPDAALLTGGDDAMRHFTALWNGIPMLVRSHRSSAALIEGTESDADLRGLADDIFRYNSLGCRNVSLLLLPEGYDVERLAAILADNAEGFGRLHRENYLHRRALLTMQGRQFIDGGGFLLCEEGRFPDSIAQIDYMFYSAVADAAEWLEAHDAELQCVVTDALRHPRRAQFGSAQRPTLTDCPDGKDPMAFLLAL